MKTMGSDISSSLRRGLLLLSLSDPWPYNGQAISRGWAAVLATPKRRLLVVGRAAGFIAWLGTDPAQLARLDAG